MSEPLLGINPDGTWAWVANEYEDIKAFVGNWIDLAGGAGPVSGFVDDEGMLNGRELNVPGSVALGRPIYGPVVLCDPNPDDEGNTLPPERGAGLAFAGLADIWKGVVLEATRLGQDLTVRANAETLTPPQFIEMTDTQMKRWLFTGEVPLDE